MRLVGAARRCRFALTCAVRRVRRATGPRCSNPRRDRANAETGLSAPTPTRKFKSHLIACGHGVPRLWPHYACYLADRPSGTRNAGNYLFPIRLAGFGGGAPRWLCGGALLLGQEATRTLLARAVDGLVSGSLQGRFSLFKIKSLTHAFHPKNRQEQSRRSDSPKYTTRRLAACRWSRDNEGSFQSGAEWQPPGFRGRQPPHVCGHEPLILRLRPVAGRRATRCSRAPAKPKSFAHR